MGVNYTPNAQLPIPDVDAARDIPYWLGQLGAVLDTKVVLRATSATDRDSLYGSAPLGTLCVSTTDGSLWVKVTDQATVPQRWQVVWEPRVITPIPITLAPGYTTVNNKPAIAVFNPASREWALWGNIAKSNGTSINAFDVMGYLPPQVQVPNYQAWFDCAVPIQHDGSITAWYNYAASKISCFTDNYRLTYWGTPATWVGLDGFRLPFAESQ